MEAKYVLRRLLRSPMFTAVTLLTLAIGIGANTAMFSIINSVLLKPLPYPDAERLVAVWHSAPGIGIPELNTSPGTYFTYNDENRTLVGGMNMWNSGAETVTGFGDPERADSLYLTANTFPILGAVPEAGRLFTATDDAPKAPDTVILSHGYWQRKFGGDRAAIGRTLQIGGKSYEIIGVLPESFRFLNERPSLYLPMRLDRSTTKLGNFSYRSIARLKPGVSIDQANADIARMFPMMLEKFPPPPGISVQMFREAKIGPNIHPLRKEIVGDIGKMLWVLMATVGIVLFIACANVANLILVRTEGRQQEIAVRTALGAGWGRICRELLTESLLLGLFGGALGLAIAYGALQLLIAYGPVNLPRLHDIQIDPLVLAFTVVISLIAGLLFGLAPVFKYAGPNLGTALRAGGRTISDGRERHRTRNALVVVQIALALVLLIASGLMIRTFQGLRQVPPGFTQPEQILTLRLSIPEAQVPKSEQVVRMQSEILRRISEIPTVRSAAMVNGITMDGTSNNDPIFAQDRVYAENQIPPVRRYKYVSPGVFQTMGNPIVTGRDVTWTDIFEMRPVVLVSESLARELWGSPAAALGKRVRENTKSPWREVIGVAANERDNGVDQKAPTIVYWPIQVKQLWDDEIAIRRSLAVAIRSPRAGSAGFLKEVQQAVWSVNPDLPLARVRTVEEIYNRSMARTSFTMVMLGIAGGMALLLGVIGIYGVISYSVSQRTREIGIRMALGAPQSKVAGMFVRHGFVLAGIGVACGLAIAIPLSRLMSTLLFEVSPIDPATYIAVAICLVAAALLATYIPARRATTVEPLEALRAE